MFRRIRTLAIIAMIVALTALIPVATKAAPRGLPVPKTAYSGDRIGFYGLYQGFYGKYDVTGEYTLPFGPNGESYLYFVVCPNPVWITIEPESGAGESVSLVECYSAYKLRHQTGTNT